MFRNASSFNIDLSSWNIAKVTNINDLFNGGTSYNHTLCGTFITSTAEKNNMFLNAGSNAKIATKHCCGVGKYTSALVPNTCEPCKVGTYQDEASTGAPCKLCNAGHYSTSGLGQSSKTVCNNKCPPGTWNTGIENTSACTDLCSPGKWSNEEGLSANSKCKACQKGQSTNNEMGSHSCSICLNGFYQPSEQQPSCTQCPVGRVFKDYCGAQDSGYHDDLDDCTPCVRATYQNELGKNECKFCPEGKAGVNGPTFVNTKIDDCKKSLTVPTPLDVKITTTTIAYSNASERTERSVFVSWQILEAELNPTSFATINNYQIQVAENNQFDDVVMDVTSDLVDARSVRLNISLVRPLWEKVLFARVRVKPSNGGSAGRWYVLVFVWARPCFVLFLFSLLMFSFCFVLLYTTDEQH